VVVAVYYVASPQRQRARLGRGGHSQPAERELDAARRHARRAEIGDFDFGGGNLQRLPHGCQHLRAVERLHFPLKTDIGRRL